MGNRNTRGRDRDRAQQTEVPVIKSLNNIKKETIKLNKYGDNKFYLNFVFSCSYECIITVYFCWTELLSNRPDTPPVMFHTPDYVAEKPWWYKFSAGIKQTFPEKAWVIDVNKFKEEDLCVLKDGEYYPIVITIETDTSDPDQEDIRATLRNKRQAQITYGKFHRNSRDEFVFMFHKQCFLFRNKLFRTEDIYGYEKAGDGEAEVFDDNQKECVVWYSTIKDTLVYPCRHICLCSQWAQVVRMQNSRCPIWRRQAEKFVNIKIESNHEVQEEPEFSQDLSINN